jgi:hypothetical protein
MNPIQVRIPIRTHPRRTRGRAVRAIARWLWVGLFVLPALAPPAASSGPSPIDLDLYARLLETHTQAVDDVAGVRVDYRGLASSSQWKALVAQVARARPSTLPRDPRLAYWINAYNILTIELILRNQPVSSIKDIGSFFSPVWNREVARIEGRAISLGEIEHEILRPMGDPRIHAAIVCASLSCPPLARTPFRSETLEADLSAAMRRWLANPQKGLRIDRDARRLRISRIFDWFEDDFESTGGVRATIERYVDEDDSRWLRSEGKTASIRYLDYDWSLNQWLR